VEDQQAIVFDLLPTTKTEWHMPLTHVPILHRACLL